MYPKESLWQNFEGYFRKPYFWQKWPKTAHIDPNSPRSPGWPEVVKQFESPNIALEILMGTSSGFDLTSSVSTLLAKENSLFKQSCLQQWLVNSITGGALQWSIIWTKGFSACRFTWGGKHVIWSLGAVGTGWPRQSPSGHKPVVQASAAICPWLARPQSKSQAWCALAWPALLSSCLGGELRTVTGWQVAKRI